MNVFPRHLVRGIATVPLFAIGAIAQCQIDWLPGQEAPGPVGSVHALAVAANGDLVVGGRFAVAGGVIANNVARYDGSAWQAFGAGIDGRVDCVLPLPNGQLIAAGLFDSAGNAPASNIARWNGADWFPLGLGVDGRVRDLALLPNGDVVAVGAFQMAGGVAAPGAALWDGLGWAALGAGPNVTQVNSVTVLPSGDIVVGGDANVGVPNVERFDGVAWSPLNGVTAGQIISVAAVQSLPNGDVVIAGPILGGSAVLGLWNGSQLLPLAPPFAFIRDLGRDLNGDLLVVGQNMALPISPPLARFDGTSWTLVGNAVDHPYERLAVGANGALYVARSAQSPSTVDESNIASLELGQWVPLPTAPVADVGALAALPNGDIVVGGAFQSIGGVAASNVARFTGAGYAPLSLGVDGPVTALAAAPDGSVLVGGSFQNAGGSPAASVARWSGTSWSTLGSGPGFTPQFLAAGAAGRVLAIGFLQAAIFDGQGWTGFALPGGGARDALALPNGDFLVAGLFVVSTPASLAGVLRIGTAGVSVETAIPSTRAGSLEFGADGAIYVTVTAPTLELFRYDGVTAQSLGSLPAGVVELQLMPNGDFVGLTANASATGAVVVRYDGTSWTQVLPELSNGFAHDLAVGMRGDIFAAGTFQTAGNLVSYGLAHATTNCPASVVAFGAGCVGSAGPATLAATGLPWIGGEVAQVVTGLAPLSLAVHVVGVASNVVPLPLGAPGCSLVVDPLLLGLLQPNAGVAEAPLSIPTAPALVGQNVFTQVVGVELDANLNVVQTTASNGLRLTVGVF